MNIIKELNDCITDPVLAHASRTRKKLIAIRDAIKLMRREIFEDEKTNS